MPRLSIFWQLFLAFGSIVLLALVLLGFLVGNWIETFAFSQVEERLQAKAWLLREIIERHPSDNLKEHLQSMKQKLKSRITLVRKDGTVLLESESEGPFDNHSDRPEIQQARTKEVGFSRRYSTTLKKNILYAAVAAGGHPEIAYVRVGLDVDDVLDRAALMRNLVWGTAGLVFLLTMFIAWWLAHRFTEPLQKVIHGAEKIAQGAYGHKIYSTRHDEVGELAHTFNRMSVQLEQQFLQLDEDRQQLRAVLSSMVEGVIAIDAEQHVLFANDRAGQMLEFPPKQAAGRKLWEVARHHAVQDLVREAMSQVGDSESRLEFFVPSGKSLSLHIAQLPGEPIRGAVLVFHDRTELRRLEGLRQEFVANVSHELKTPLSVITACVETLLDGGVEDVQHRGRFLERIQDQAQRLHLLILDLLSLARIEAGEQSFDLQPLSLSQQISSCLERHQARAQTKQQQLVAQPPLGEEDLVVLADEEALCEILDNLIDNAVKYTPAGGTIQIRWRRDGNQCSIEVQDTGIGIAESELPRIFERFYRVDKARSREMGGTGLGLSIVKHLTQSLNGSIRAASVVGQGTTFTVQLPLAS